MYKGKVLISIKKNNENYKFCKKGRIICFNHMSWQVEIWFFFQKIMITIRGLRVFSLTIAKVWFKVHTPGINTDSYAEIFHVDLHNVKHIGIIFTKRVGEGNSTSQDPLQKKAGSAKNYVCYRDMVILYSRWNDQFKQHQRRRSRDGRQQRCLLKSFIRRN